MSPAWYPVKFKTSTLTYYSSALQTLNLPVPTIIWANFLKSLCLSIYILFNSVSLENLTNQTGWIPEILWRGKKKKKQKLRIKRTLKKIKGNFKVSRRLKTAAASGAGYDLLSSHASLKGVLLPWVFNDPGRWVVLNYCAVSNPIDLLIIWFLLLYYTICTFLLNIWYFSNFNVLNIPLNICLIALEFKFRDPLY